MSKGFFKYDEQADREWFEIELHNGTPFSRATIQDYARCMDKTPNDWVHDALVWFMHECDRQGAHGTPTPVRKPVERKPVPAWRTRLADRLYGWAMKLDVTENDDLQCY